MRRRWCFTYFADDIADDSVIKKLRELPNFRGIAFQWEKCPSTQRLHIQGYVEFQTSVRFSRLKSLCEKTHWKAAGGSREQNVAYVTKPDSRVASGVVDDVLRTPQRRGERTDIHEAVEYISSAGTTFADVCEEHPMYVLRYPRGIRELLSQKQRSKSYVLRPEIRVEVIIGEAGTGKTRYALRDLSSTYLLDASNSSAVWFDGYDSQSTLVLDDFYGWIQHGSLLRYLDLYPVRLPIKGGHAYAAWNRVYITSNRHPSTWYPSRPWNEDLPLRRRIHRIWIVSKTLFGYLWTCELTKAVMQFDENFNLLE
jgi:hypothetical protein